jgi:hypothetical protein
LCFHTSTVLEGGRMDSSAADPIIIGLMFVARCAVPLVIMLGLSYLLKRLGLIQEPPPAPKNGANNGVNVVNHSEGDIANGKF